LQYNIIQHMVSVKENKIRNLIVVGDRVLIRPKAFTEKTGAGLYLPPGVQEKEQIQSGYVIKTGPGYPVPNLNEEEIWSREEEKTRYIPLQAKEGDLAIFLQKSSFEVIYENEKYFIVPHSAILLLERDEELFR
jgi:chaperonin GroES